MAVLSAVDDHQTNSPLTRPPGGVMTELSKLGQTALSYAKRGWRVFPVHGITEGHCDCGKADCPHPGKVPYTAHGFKDATMNPEQIREWWKRWPNANIGFAVGKWIVLDVDGPEGEANLRALEEEYGTLPETSTVQTGRGRHLYFSPNGRSVRCSAGKLGDHLDIRAEGGYVILPPSVHVCGKVYEWVPNRKPALWPEWFTQLLTGPEPKRQSNDGVGEKIPEGQRNAYLTSLAGSMRSRGMDEAAMKAALLVQNQEHCSPPLPDSEVGSIAHSIANYEPSSPGSKNPAERISLAKLRAFSNIQPEALRWLWPGRLPLGKLTVIAGDPGLGKSLLTIDVAARVSSGRAFPDGASCERGTVILLSAEDDPGDTIRPRLDAAEADVSHVHLLEAVRNVTTDGKAIETTFNLERDLDALEDAVQRTGARLVVIDPVSAYLGATDSHNNSAVRGLLKPLTALAARYHVAVVAVTHLRKSSGAAIHRIVESLAFGATGRSAWGVAADPDDNARRLFASIKQNLAKDGGGLAYRIQADEGEVAHIEWEPGAVAIDVNMLMGGFESREANSERREASEWLQDYLDLGPQPASDVKAKARTIGLAWITVRRAADSIGIIKRKIGGRGAGWEWALPGYPVSDKDEGIEGEDNQGEKAQGKDAQFKDAHPTERGVSTFDNATENTGDNMQSKVKDAHLTDTEHLYPVSTFEEGQI